MKCHWCNKTLEKLGKDHPEYIECPDVHSLITFDPVVEASSSLIEAVTEYVLYHDINEIRYKMVGHKLNNYTLLHKRIGARGYKLALTIKYIPLKIEDDIISMKPLLSKLKKLVIFS